MKEQIIVKKEYYYEGDKRIEDLYRALQEVEVELVEARHRLQETEDDLKFLTEEEFSEEIIKSAKTMMREIRNTIDKLENIKNKFETQLLRSKDVDDKLDKISSKHHSDQPQ